MAVYAWKGLDAGGKEQRGQIEAADEKAAARLLRSRSVYVTRLDAKNAQADGEKGAGAAGSPFSIMRYMPVTGGDLVSLYRQLALMLKSGFALVAALEACAELQPKLRLSRAVERVGRKILEGESFSSALAAEGKIFPPLATQMISSGEQSGNLDAILERLAESLERGKELKRQLLTAMFYPCIVLVATIGLIIVMAVFVIPKFATFLAARHAELPDSTQTLLDISDWAVDWGGLVGSVAGVAVFLILAVYTTRPGKNAIDKVILSIPIIGKLVLFAAMAQAGWSLAMLLKSGLTALESLRIIHKIIGNMPVAECFHHAAEGLLLGQSLAKTLDQPYIPLMMRRMVAVGEKSGRLDTVMQSVGEYYQQELVARLKFLTAAVEPALILTAGSVVFYVYRALFQAVMAVSKGGM
jgi:type IV pilus assembly protein PilC